MRDFILDQLDERPALRRAVLRHLMDEGDAGGLRERLRERVRDRFDDDEGGVRGRLRDRVQGTVRDDDDDDGGGVRGRLRERVRGRLSDDGGGCFIASRSLRDEDGDFVIVIRRRICRD